MIKEPKNMSLQDTLLKEFVKNRSIIEVNLVNGLILTGIVINFDNFCINLESKNKNIFLYKHSIAFIEKKNKK